MRLTLLLGLLLAALPAAAQSDDVRMCTDTTFVRQGDDGLLTFGIDAGDPDQEFVCIDSVSIESGAVRFRGRMMLPGSTFDGIATGLTEAIGAELPADSGVASADLAALGSAVSLALSRSFVIDMNAAIDCGAATPPQLSLRLVDLTGAVIVELPPAVVASSFGSLLVELRESFADICPD